MNTAAVIRFPKPQVLKQEAEMSIEQKEDGYTPLPNFVCDEGYLAVLDGEAIKCLVFLNRHIKGFHLSNKGMSETLVKKITGIKDGRTVQKYMSQLAHYQLIRIEKERGKSNVYFITFEDRLPTQHVGTFNAPTQNAPTCDAGGQPTQHVGTTTYTACGAVKETYLKENLKDKKKNVLVDNSESEMFGSSVKYHDDDKKQYSLRELANVYTVQTDLAEQAKRIDPKLDDAKILSELKNFAQWSTGREKTTAQGWMNYWIYRIQKLAAPKAKFSKPAQAKRKGLSDAQVDYFASKLTDFHEFASMYANVGETQKSFTARIASKLRDPKHLDQWASYLKDVGFAGKIEDFTL